MKNLKRSLALMLVVCMLCTLLPVSALAADTTVPHMATMPADSTVSGQPFDTTASKNHRIPGLVNHNGTLIAAADARWDEEYDGGNIDIVVSRSEDGVNWNYSYAAYLGDHGNAHNKGASTMMDPVIITDGETLYLLYDLFAAGWSLNGGDNTNYAFNTQGRSGTGFDGEGRLLLGKTYNGSEWNYYLDGEAIKDSNGTETGYTVDEWFNVYDNTGAYQSNLFFDEESPFYVFPTCYFAMQKSTDDGKSWSDPQLLDIKREGAWWEVLGPGSGLVTKDRNLAFTTYDGSNISLVYGKGNTWNKVTTNAANNESSIVELADGTIRAFVKNNNNRVCYVDFTKTADGYTAGSLQNTGVANTGWCMVSSMLYSKTKNGQQVILVSCPNNVDGDTRSNGTVYAFTANDMQLIGSFQIDTGYDNQFFAYSDMAELSDGTIAMLYEDGCKYYKSGNGAGYSHISYTSFDPAEKMGITFDAVNSSGVNVFLGVGEEQTITDNTGVYTNVDTSKLDTSIANVAITGTNNVYETKLSANVTSITSGSTYVLYNKSARKLMNNQWANAAVGGGGTNGLALSSSKDNFQANDYWTITTDTNGNYYVQDQSGKYLSIARGKAELKTDPVVINLAYDSTDWTIGENGEYANNFGGAHTAVAGWNDINDVGAQWEIYEVITTPVDVSTEITFEGVALGKTSAVVGGTQYNITVLNSVDVEVKTGGEKTVTDNTGNYAIVKEPEASKATMTVTGTPAVKNLVEITSLDQIKSGKSYLITSRNGQHVLTDDADGAGRLNIGDVATVDSTELWTFTSANNGNSEYFTIARNGKYLNIANNSITMNANAQNLRVYRATYNGETHWIIADGNGNSLNNDGQRNDYAGEWSPDAGGLWRIYEIVENPGTTEITFEGVSVGETTAVVGNTKYNITVIPGMIDVNMQVSEVVEFFNNTGDVQTGHDTSVANVILSRKLLSVNSIESGKQYLIVNKATGLVLYDNEIQIHGAHENRDGLKTSGQASVGSTELWTITSDGNGGYTVVQDGNYLAIAGYVAYAGTTYQPALNLNYTANGWTISDDETHVTLNHDNNPFYLSNNVGDNYSGGALGTGNTSNPYIYWDIYEVAPAVKITGLSKGQTVATVGTIKYNINVTMADLAMTVYLGMDKTTPVTGTVTDEDIEDFNNTYGGTVTVARKGNNLVFTAVSAGEVPDAVLGGTKYTITVPAEEVRDIVLYEGVVIRDVIAGSAYDNFDAVQPDNTKAYIHGVTNKDGETAVVFTGVGEGTTEAQVGHVKYRITVKSLTSGGDIADFTSIVGEKYYQDYKANNPSDLDMTGKLIKSLRITEGATFDLGVDVTGYDSITWTSADPAIATVANAATDTVDPGMVTAVKEGQTVITATVTKGGVTESISVHVTVVPSMVTGYTGDDICTVFFYIDQVEDTDPYYTMFLTTENMTGPVENHEMIMVAEDEVIWYERPKEGAWAMLWTADPWDQHALTYMASTGTAGDYFPLQNDDGELGSGTVNDVKYYKGNNAYNNIVNVSTAVGGNWTNSLNDVLENSIHVGENYWEDPGCDGAMSTSRNSNDRNTPYLVTSLTFISEPLPELDKRIYGVLSATGKRENDGWQLYHDGMYATVGQYVYYAITLTQKAPLSWKINKNTGNIETDAVGQLAALEYTNDVRIVDRLMTPIQDDEGNVVYVPNTMVFNPPYFYTKDLDAQDGNHNNTPEPNDDGYIERADLQKNNQAVTDLLNAGWTQEQIDAGQRVHEFYVVYKIQSQDNNTMLVNGASMDYEYSSTYSSGKHSSAANAAAEMYILGESLGDVVVDFGLPVTIDDLTTNHLADRFDEEKTNNAVGGAKYGYVDIAANDDGTYSVTYTPDTIFQGYDVVYLMDDNNNLLNYFRVYPATTVFYEEPFLTPAADEKVEAQAGGAAWTQVGTPVSGPQMLEFMAEDGKVNPYGYDGVYDNAAHQNGSSGSYLSANTIGATTSFKFTGTGFDLYANCAGNSGYVGVLVQDSNGNYVKMYTVDTAIVTDDSEVDNQYDLPIIAVDLGTHGTYTVTVIKVMDRDDVKLDGIRIYNTIADSTIFKDHLEDNPEFYELRDYVLNAVDANKEASKMYGDDWMEKLKDDDTANELIGALAGQVYGDIGEDDEKPTAVVTSTDPYFENTSVQELLDNGPKNELFLHPTQTLTFSVKTARAIQIGLKAPVGATSYTLSYTVTEGENTTTTTVATNADLKTSVDMFRALDNTIGTEKTYLVSISNTGNSILSVTDLKICDDPNAAFVSLSEADIEQVLLNAFGFDRKPEVKMSFVDVPEESFYYDSVLWALKEEFTNGVTEDHFGPDVACNRAQVVTFLWRAAGSPEPTVAEHNFVDVEAGSFYEKAVMWAVENDITKGIDDSHFAPEMECNRATVVTFLYRASEDKQVVSEENPFSDVPADAWYTTPVLWAVEKNITNGIGDGLFGVDNICNRAQIVTFLYRAKN